MADISMLDTVATDDVITAGHHNDQNTAITNVNDEVTAVLGMLFLGLGG